MLLGATIFQARSYSTVANQAKSFRRMILRHGLVPLRYVKLGPAGIIYLKLL